MPLEDTMDTEDRKPLDMDDGWWMDEGLSLRAGDNDSGIVWHDLLRAETLHLTDFANNDHMLLVAQCVARSSGGP